MTKPKWGEARVVFVAATGGENNEIRRMIAAGHSLAAVYARFRGNLTGCSYDTFRRHAQTILGVSKGAKRTRIREDENVRSEPRRGRDEHRGRGRRFVEEHDSSCSPPETLARLRTVKPTNG